MLCLSYSQLSQSCCETTIASSETTLHTAALGALLAGKHHARFTRMQSSLLQFSANKRDELRKLSNNTTQSTDAVHPTKKQRERVTSATKPQSNIHTLQQALTERMAWCLLNTGTDTHAILVKERASAVCMSAPATASHR
jgi:hypothetical protein